MDTQKKTFLPHNTVILWDLHEVLFKKSRWEWIKICITFNRKWKIIRALDVKILRIMALFILEQLYIIKKRLVSEELLYSAYAAHNDALADLIIMVSSAYTPIEPSILILKELSLRGYTHHVGSNISTVVFKYCQGKFDTIFSHFSQFTIPFYTTDNKIVKKPHQFFFATHLEKNNLLAEHVIFIDDKESNVVAARSIGIHAIHFISSDQLRKELVNLGLL